MKKRGVYRLYWGLFTLLFSGLVSATEDPSNWKFSLGLGLGQRTNPVMDNDALPLVVLPLVSYQHSRWFIQNLDFGYSLVENERHQLNLLFTPSYDQVFFHHSGLSDYLVSASNWATLTKTDVGPNSPNQLNDVHIDKNKLSPRRTALLGGLEWRVSLDDTSELNIACLSEITGYYNGQECRLAITKEFVIDQHHLSLTLGQSWQSAAGINYFYGLDGTEGENLKAYQPNAGTSSLLRIDWLYPMSTSWDLRLFASYKQLPNEVTRSPLISDDKVVTFFAGGVYHF